MNALANKLSPSATTMIRLDHSHVLITFHKYHVDSAPSVKRGLADTVCMALEVHAQLEEEIFYPAMRELDPQGEVIGKSVPEHDEMRRLIAKLRAMDPTDADFDKTFMALMRDVMHHVADEETVLLPQAELVLADRLNELGAQMTRRRLQLVAPRTGELAVSMFKAMPASSLIMVAGAVLAGSYVAHRAIGDRH